MIPLYAYAVSNGEGTLIEYGEATENELKPIYELIEKEKWSIIIGPADGTGE